MDHKNEKVRGQTQSLCPICLERISAEIVKIDEDIYLRKKCEEHGDFQTIIWRGEPDYFSWRKQKQPVYSKPNLAEKNKGCPFDCGLCPDHCQQICCVQFEVTKRCNLSCPVCFADAGKEPIIDPSIEELIDQMKIIWDTSGKCNIQLSGGEPTLRDDLPEIIKVASSLGFSFFQLNTNGIRLAEDLDYVKALKEAGLSTVFLQFDGIEDEIYEKLRGQKLFQVKQKAIENCGRNSIGVVLVPTLVPGINTDHIGEIVKYALKGLPVIRGIHFQPISYFGRYPSPPKDEDRFTLPEVIRALEQQSQGLLKVENFVPSDCEDSLCSFHGDFIYLENGVLAPYNQKQDLGSKCCREGLENEAALRAQNYVARRWQLNNVEESKLDEHEKDDFDRFLDRIQNYRLSITCMTFQDVENLDLERLKYCSVPVVNNGKAIPFCAYNLTNRMGHSLYKDI